MLKDRDVVRKIIFLHDIFSLFNYNLLNKHDIMFVFTALLHYVMKGIDNYIMIGIVLYSKNNKSKFIKEV